MSRLNLSLRPVLREDHLKRYPWGRDFLPGTGGYEDFRHWNEIIREINPYLFIACAPEGVHKDNNGVSRPTLEIWEHVNVGLATRLFVWADPKTGAPRPLDERLIDEVIIPTDREKWTPERKEAVLRKKELEIAVERQKDKESFQDELRAEINRDSYGWKEKEGLAPNWKKPITVVMPKE